MTTSHWKSVSRIRRAASAVLENLETRQMFAGDASIVRNLPFALEFDGAADGMADKNGLGTGFTWVQANKNNNEYQPGLIQLDTASGLLKLTTAGTAAAGSNWEGDNTLVNGLQTQFDARTGTFTITTRIKGPLGFIDQPSEQAGIVLGPDQDNWIKLVAVAQTVGGVTGQYLQLLDESAISGGYAHTLNGSASLTNIGSFASIQTLDLKLVGDAATGKITAFYRINGGALTKLTQQLTLSGARKDAIFSAAARAGLIALHKNDLGPITVNFDRFEIVAGAPADASPTITATRPAQGETGVARDAFIAADVHLPNPGKGVDAATLTSDAVRLYRTSDHALVAGNLNTSGGGDAVVFQPTGLLDANTMYTFEVTAALKDTGGVSFTPYTATFTTGDTAVQTDSSIAFEKVTLPSASGQQFTGVTVGPDGKLYAATITGLIERFAINNDGTLGAAQIIKTVQNNNGGPRFLTGLTFDPSSTANNLILWVSHGQYAFENATDWTGKVSRLSGANLTTYQDYVVDLPRSVRDHLTNQISFGPDGALYFSQASNTAMGAPDNAWGLRPERLLSASVLRLDTAAVAQRIAAGQGALNAKTEGDGNYNPFAPGAPLTIYATGVRNAYDLVWHSNGNLYAPTNGSASGGNTPSYAGGVYAGTRVDDAANGPYNIPTINGSNDVRQTEDDFLFRIVQGGYYGHPNPTRGEFILDGGNPTSAVDYEEFTTYGVGTQPDRNYRGAAYVFGKNYSPDGAVEYKGNAFNGALNGKILVTRYSGGDDVLVLTPGANGDISAAQSGIAGLTHFVDPLDITEDNRTGFLYVAEYGGQRITLLRPITPGANIVADKQKLVFNDVRGGSAAPAQKIVITNNGTSPLAFPADGLSITGASAAMFTFTGKPTLPTTIPVGGSVELSIAFSAPSTTTQDIKTATLVIKSNDPDQPVLNITLRGLPTLGTGGQNEPSLQSVFDLYQLPINTGDTNPANTNLFSDAEPLNPVNDEVDAQRLVKAGAGPVTIEPLAAFGVNSNPVLRFGWYQSGSIQSKTELFTVPTASAQTVNVTVNGTTSFDPGDTTFGFYSIWPGLANNTAYSEDVLNTQENVVANRRKVRFYQLRNADGSIVPNAYMMAHEDYANDTGGAYDNQDIVAIIRNVAIAPAGPEVGIDNTDGVPFYNRFVFNRIQRQPPDPKTDPATGVVTQPPNNKVHDTAVVRIRNTGAQPLTLNNLTLSSPSWTLVNPPAAGTQIAPNSYYDLTVQFVAQGIPATQTDNQTVGAAKNTGGAWNGTLTITTDDADEPNTVVQLAGWWQERSEWNQEPNLGTLVNKIYGYGTTILNAGDSLDQGGRSTSVGEEVLSSYWTRADSTSAVTVRQLAAFHTQGNTEIIKAYLKGATSSTEIFTHDGTEGQSLLPHLASGAIAQGNVSSSIVTGTFGFRIQASYSDDAKNYQQQSNTASGHNLRFFPVRDAAGNLVPNTYLIAHDYILLDPVTGAVISNYDYQDNLYLVTNIKPAAPAAPANLTVNADPAGLKADWNDVSSTLLAGYNIYRSANGTSGFTKLNPSPLTASEFVDATVAGGATFYYRVTAVDRFGTESAVSTVVSGTRPADSTPPAVPAGLAALGQQTGVVLTWTANTDADLAGYRVYRSDTAAGTYTLLNSALATTATYTDATAAQGATYFYVVSAVDSTGNESAKSAAVSATRPIETDTTAPSVPANVVATGRTDGVLVSWKANTEIDLAGYRVFRSDTPGGVYVAINNGALQTAASLLDTTTLPGSSYSYRITAVDTTGNESGASTIVTGARLLPPDMTPPAAPTGLAASGQLAGVALAWAANVEADLAGYFVYRADAAGGAYVKLNGGQLVSAASFLDNTAISGTVYSYKVSAVDTAGNESTLSAPAAGVRTPAPDTTPPAVPVNLGATGQMDGIRLVWSANGEADLAGYKVYRSDSAKGPFTLLSGAAFLSAATFLDTQVVVGQQWFYAISAVDTAGNESALSASVSAVRPAAADTTPPAAPAGLGAAGRQDGVSLNWNANGESDFAGYRLYRAVEGGTYSLVAAGLSATAYLDTTAAAGVAYSYVLTAMDTAGNESAVSIAAGATRLAPADTTAPAVPTGLGTNGQTDGVAVSWVANVEADLAGYRVYRAASPEGPFSPLANGQLVAAASFKDVTAAVGTTYWYAVTAVDATGNESALSAPVKGALGVVTQPPAGPVKTLAFGGKKSVSYTDANGVLVTLKLSGPGAGEVRFYDDANRVVDVAVTGATGATTLSATTKRGATTLRNLIVDGALRSLSAKTIDLAASLRVTQGVGTLTLHDVAAGGAIDLGSALAVSATFNNVASAHFTSAAAVKSLKATTWLGGGDSAIVAPYVKTLKVGGDFAANLSAGQVDSLTVGGTISDARIAAQNRLGSISAGAIGDSLLFAGVRDGGTAAPTALADFTDPSAVIVSVKIKGKVAPAGLTIAAPHIGALKLGNAAGAIVNVGSAGITSLSVATTDGLIRRSRLSTAADSFVGADLAVTIVQ